MSDTTPAAPAAESAPRSFTADEIRQLRPVLASMPYSGNVALSSALVRDIPTLVRWLIDLREQMQQAAVSHERAVAAADAAEAVIRAGRTIAAAMQPPPSSDDIKTAILAAITEHGESGAAIEEIDIWVRRNRMWPLVTRFTIKSHLNTIVRNGRVYGVENDRGWTRWVLRETQDAGDGPSLDSAILLAVLDQAEHGADLPTIQRWILDNRTGGPVPGAVVRDRIAVLVASGNLTETRGPSWVKWFVPAQPACTDCETDGVNCLAHRKPEQQARAGW